MKLFILILSIILFFVLLFGIPAIIHFYLPFDWFSEWYGLPVFLTFFIVFIVAIYFFIASYCNYYE